MASTITEAHLETVCRRLRAAPEPLFGDSRLIGFPR